MSESFHVLQGTLVVAHCWTTWPGEPSA